MGQVSTRTCAGVVATLLLAACSAEEENPPRTGPDTGTSATSVMAAPGGSEASAPGNGDSDSDTDFGNPSPVAAGATASFGAGMTASMTGTAGFAPETCAETTVFASRVTPTVILIVDQSSSMNDRFERDRSRWDVLRDFLLGTPDGLIASLQSQVRFGLALYSAESGGENPEPIGDCPIVTQVAPALDNYDALAQVYASAEPIEDTPTGDAIDVVLDGLTLEENPDLQADPIVFILATDGEPDQCEQLDPQDGQQEAVAAVQRAFQLGIRTFIISVGNEISAEHQQAMANAGLGHQPADADAEFWVAGDDQSLRMALSDIVGSQLDCEVELDGSVEGDVCLGSVTLNGRDLECEGSDGWELSDSRHIRLNGVACDELKSSSDVLLDVSFPCGVDVVF